MEDVSNRHEKTGRRYEALLPDSLQPRMWELDRTELHRVIAALGEELDAPTSADDEIIDEKGVAYTCRFLITGHRVAFRPLTPEELELHGGVVGRETSTAFLVADISGEQ